MDHWTGVKEKKKKIVRFNPTKKSGHVHAGTRIDIGTHLNTIEIRSGDDYSTIIARGGE